MQTGNYGKVKEAYATARQAFPQEVIKYIFQQTSEPEPSILDLGCGTGIATRQLASNKNASLIGCDIDSQMIIEAETKPLPNIRYVVAPASELPFESNSFDAITAFSAFHWFKDMSSLVEILRIIKEDGLFFAINNNDIRGFRIHYKQKLAHLIGRALPNPKDDYNPAEILQEAGFFDISTKTFISREVFSPRDALTHIQSAAAWGEVPPEKESEAVELMKNHIRETMMNGQAVRDLEVVVVSGKKPVPSTGHSLNTPPLI